MTQRGSCRPFEVPGIAVSNDPKPVDGCAKGECSGHVDPGWPQRCLKEDESAGQNECQRLPDEHGGASVERHQKDLVEACHSSEVDDGKENAADRNRWPERGQEPVHCKLESDRTDHEDCEA